ncbi:MAG: hypothetical protein U0Q12_18025 [Vicinamibacterales bacterium]
MLNAAACGGSSSPTGPSSSSSGSLTESFASIQSVVFASKCTSCHGATRTEASLNLQTGAYANLVNRRSTQTAFLLVSPNDPENSYLIHKLEGRSGIVGTRMPQTGAALSTSDIDVIKRWIQSGAPNN